MISINYCGKELFQAEINCSLLTINNEIKDRLGFCINDYYIIHNGKRFTDSHVQDKCLLHVIPKLLGGKGGFGSMLRAIGAQIEKTTNREACRDLSGRRLRDINEEKRLKTWIAQQIERENEADDKRQKKLERLCKTPKHEFKDEIYEQERAMLTEKVENALEQGLKASTSTSTSNNKRKHTEEKTKPKKKRLWLEEEELSSSDNESENDDNSNASNTDNKTKDENQTEIIEKSQ